MEIDEISLVDRGANQHAAIVISKALGPDEEGDVSVVQEEFDLYDAEGYPVDELEHGDVVYDEEGNAFQYTEDDDDDEDIEKAGFGGALSAFRGSQPFGRAQESFRIGRGLAGKGKYKSYKGLEATMAETGAGSPGRIGRSAAHVGYHAPKYAAGVGGTAVAGGGGGVVAVNHKKKNQSDWYGGKSLGDVVLEELSKAASDDDREQIIAKAMDEVEIAKARARNEKRFGTPAAAG